MTLPPFRYSLLFLVLLFTAEGTRAQCPPVPSVQQALDSWDVELTLSAIRQAENCEGYRDSLGWAYHRLGVFYYYDEALSPEERVAKALQATRRAIDIRSGLSPLPYEQVGQSYLNLAFFYQDQLNYDEAAKEALTALEAFEKAEAPQAINCLWKLADIMELLGDYGKALHYLELAREKALRFKDTLRLADSYNVIGRAFNAQGLHQEALEPLNQAYTLFSSRPRDQRDDYQLASCLLNLGNTYDGLGRFEEALAAYQAALQHARRYGDPGLELSIKNNIAIPLKKLGRLAESEQALREVLRYAMEKESQKDMAAAYDNLGDLYFLRGDFSRALELYQQAIVHTVSGFQPESMVDEPSGSMLEKAADKARLLNFLSNRAQTWKAYYEKDQKREYLGHALQCYRLADQVIGLMRQEHSEQSSKLFWRNTTRPVYEQAIETAYWLGDAEQAFFFMEKSRAVLLLDALLAGNARQVVPDSIARRELQLKRRLLTARQSMENGEGDAARLLDAQRTLERFLDELAEAYPAYHDIRYNLVVAHPEQVQAQLLDEETLLVEYFLSGEFIYILHFSRAVAPKLVRMPRDEAFAQQLQGVLSYLSGAGEAGPDAYQAMAYPLFQRLLEPAYAPQYSRLLIIPDGELSFLPFDALPGSLGQPASFGQVDYLIRDHNVYYAYSATVLSNLIRNDGASGSLLQIAPGFEQGERSLAPLSEGGRGMERLDGYRILRGREATKARFLEQASQAWLIHLTTHASAGAEAAGPRIEFIDQPLGLPELYALELSAQLVVLDACQANLGTIATGEGVMSLARGFAFAGARSMVASLWEVRDRYTAILFQAFYRQLSAGKSKSEALRQAKLAYLAQAQTSAEKSPRNWAGFVYIGKDGTMAVREASTLQSWFAGYGRLAGLLLLAGIAGWFLRRKR
ncbi:MAG: CHAT domain-containing protein [Phaeodactylibacter sp.]|nr:CHAT domain-containing protein [Phaeodactylibacter sp.]MCB9051789.1 CHAT domain-containing protein [Lewinellaceae bacterium]